MEAIHRQAPTEKLQGKKLWWKVLGMRSFQSQRLGMARKLVKAIERSDRSNRTCLYYFYYFLMLRCKWLTCRLGVARGYLQGHGEAARPTWEDSKEWVGQGVGATVRAWERQG